MGINHLQSNQKIHTLFDSQYFKSLSIGDLNSLKKHSKEVVYRKKEVICKQGMPVTNLIFHKSGLVKIGLNGFYKELILRIGSAPAFLGLYSVFGSEAYPYTITALEKTAVYFIEKNIFMQIISKNPKFAKEIMADICEQSLSYINQNSNCIQKQLNGRLADILLLFARDIYKNHTFSLPVNRNELASFACTSRESVTRALSDLKKDNIIELHNNNICIKNIKMLEKISKTG